MKPFDEKVHERYLATEESLGKAGAYSIQGLGAELIERLEGDFTTVVGFPLRVVSRLLVQGGIAVPSTLIRCISAGLTAPGTFPRRLKRREAFRKMPPSFAFLRRGLMVAQGNLVAGLLAGLFLVLINPAFAIDVKLTTEEAQKALEAGRAPMEKGEQPGRSEEGVAACLDGDPRGRRS